MVKSSPEGKDDLRLCCLMGSNLNPNNPNTTRSNRTDSNLYIDIHWPLFTAGSRATHGGSMGVRMWPPALPQAYNTPWIWSYDLWAVWKSWALEWMFHKHQLADIRAKKNCTLAIRQTIQRSVRWFIGAPVWSPEFALTKMEKEGFKFTKTLVL
jgi:hypothetical protein